MKIALCLYGYFNNKADASAGSKGYNYIKEKIINYCGLKNEQLDIFVHTWDEENLHGIYSVYQPKKLLYEQQIDFNPIAKQYGVDEEKINEGFDRKNTIYKDCTIQASLSFFYSRGKAIELAIKNSEEKEFEYDCIIAARFDLGHRSGMHRGYNVSQIDFNLNYDMKFIYSAMWVQLNAGYADQWFYSNQNNMLQLSKMYENTLTDYWHVGDFFWQRLTNGWYDSNTNDDFSNEKLKQPYEIKRSDYVYPQWQMINNHILHKWHFMQMGLYEVSKFV